MKKIHQESLIEFNILISKHIVLLTIAKQIQLQETTYWLVMNVL